MVAHSCRIFVFPFQLGGTTGDIEGMPFVEAFRQFQFKAKRENFYNIHVSLVPQVGFPDSMWTAALISFPMVFCVSHI
jgi:CTP synthase (UTP-ammonia lyase)